MIATSTYDTKTLRSFLAATLTRKTNRVSADALALRLADLKVTFIQNVATESESGVASMPGIMINCARRISDAKLNALCFAAGVETYMMVAGDVTGETVISLYWKAR